MTDSPDQLPEDLDVTAYVGPYTFPDNRRRLAPGAMYAVAGVFALVLYAVRGDAVLVNDGFLVGGLVFLALAGYHVAAAWPLKVDETEALAAAGREAGFAVGHASAQLAWRGLRSRPTWRILLYSAEDPPAQRAFVLVDGVDGEIVGRHVEANPEDWSEFGWRS